MLSEIYGKHLIFFHMEFLSVSFNSNLYPFFFENKWKKDLEIFQKEEKYIGRNMGYCYL